MPLRTFVVVGLFGGTHAPPANAPSPVASHLLPSGFTLPVLHYHVFPFFSRTTKGASGTSPLVLLISYLGLAHFLFFGLLVSHYLLHYNMHTMPSHPYCIRAIPPLALYHVAYLQHVAITRIFMIVVIREFHRVAMLFAVLSEVIIN